MKLVIIEGAGKKETIEKYLGKGYKVFATKGHIRDLPTKTLAVDVNNNFEPKYAIISDKKDTVKRMISEAQAADEVLLATDPDREGEAISWHVANVLKIPFDKKARIVFNEISKKAVQKAIESPREIDLNLVDAQQARRVLDRLVGYKLSPILCKRIQNKLSAGRVQSVTLRLIVEREREILNFKPEEYWNFFSILKKSRDKIKAALTLKNGKKIKLTSAEQVEAVKKELDGNPYIVKSVKKSTVLGKPPAPFITSSMQQDALNKLGMSLKQTTAAAQSLYEGVELPGEGKTALITYIRTDSTRVSDDAMAEARKFVSEKYGADYIPEKPNIYAAKKDAQDAHEAIRPITLSRSPESLKDVLQTNLYKLYKLIYERFLASQMSCAVYDAVTVDVDNSDYTFRVNGKTMTFPGYTAVYRSFDEEKDEEKAASKVPPLTVGEELAFVEYKCEQKFTKPPARYTEASLVKAMEEKGIGRPATYTPTVALLFNREYVEREGKAIKPTELGFTVTDMLVKYFPDILNVKFTAEMEEKLDKIEDGGTVWQQVVADFYGGFEEELAAALKDKPAAEESEYDCPECGGKMIYRNGKYGKFLACSNYPKCRCTMQIDAEGKPVTDAKPKAVETDVVCEKCGRKMVLKTGKYGQFLACPGYPKCKNIKNLDSEPEGFCPLCGKPLKKKTARNVFYGCTGYPECKFTSSYPVIEGKCPDCGEYLVKKTYKDGDYKVCGKNCGFKEKME